MEVYGRLWMFDWHMLFQSESLCVLDVKALHGRRGQLKG